MRIAIYFLILICCIALSSCPYEGSVPLSSYDNALKADKRLTGTWKTEFDDGSYDILVISKASKTVLHLIHRSYAEDGKKTEDHYYRAFACNISGLPFYTLEKKDGTYNYFIVKWLDKYQFEIKAINDMFAEERLKGHIDEHILKEFISNNQDQDGFFDDPLVFNSMNK